MPTGRATGHGLVGWTVPVHVCGPALWGLLGEVEENLKVDDLEDDLALKTHQSMNTPRITRPQNFDHK